MAYVPAAKLTPPRLPAQLVTRPHIDAVLDGVTAHRVTTVIAGAGFGKTTALAAWAARTRPAWYALGPEDDDPGTLARGLVAALRRRLPDLPGEIVTAVGGRLGPDAERDRRVDPVLVALAEALDAHVGDDLAVVLDDAQHATGAAAALLDGLCRHVPESVHLVFAARSTPPIQLQRLRGRGQVLEVDGATLAFTQEEVEELALALLGPSELAPALHTLTAGWPAAVRLALAALQRVPPAGRPAALDDLHRPGGPVAAYLLEEAIGPESPEGREALWSLATIGEADTSLLSHLGVRDAGPLLDDLSRRGLVVPAGHDAGWVCTSDVVREAVAAMPPPGRDRGSTLAAAAAWFGEHHRPERALACALAAGATADAASLLATHGADLLAHGVVEPVVAAARALPHHLLSPAAAVVAGEALQIRGDWEGALRCFRSAAGDTTELPAGLAWRMGLIHHFRGELTTADEVYSRARLDEDGGRDEALVLAWRSSVNWLLGRAEACRALAEQAYERARACEDDEALAAAHTTLAMLAALDGDRRANDAHYRSALAFAQRSGHVLQRIRIHCNRGSHLLEEGAYTAAVDELEPAIRLADLTGYAALHGLALCNRADALLHLGRLDEATADFQTALGVLGAVSSWLTGYARRGLADVWALRGSTALARAAYEDAVATAEAAGDVQGLVPALAGLARLVATDEPGLARDCAQRALDCGTGTGYVGALLAAGWVAARGGEPAEGKAYAERAAKVARTRRDRAGLAEALELCAASVDAVGSVPLLADSIRVWTELGDPIGEARATLALHAIGADSGDHDADMALRRLGELGVRPPTISVGPTEPGVAIETLGGFRVLRDGVPVPVTAWQSRKARDLLKLLLARRGRPTPREVLMEVLWPEEEEAKLGARLSVALSTARSVLDPDRRCPPDHFLAADRDTVALAHLEVDVEVFLGLASEALAAHESGRADDAAELLLRAEAAYTGDFLAEDPYSDWATPLREEARALWLAVLAALADDALARSAWDGAVRRLLRLLAHDAYDERAHLRLVGALSHAGRHGEAHRRYSVYTQRMAELGVEPAPFPDARTPSPSTSAL